MERITVDQLSEAGFSNEEISDFVETQRTSLRAAGFNDKEIDDYYGIVRPIDLSGLEPFPFETIAETHYEQIAPEAIADKKVNFEIVMKPLREQAERSGVSFLHTNTAIFGKMLVDLQEALLYLRKKDRILRYKTGLDKRKITEYSERDDENWVNNAIGLMRREIDTAGDYWQRKAQQVGITWFDEFVSGLLNSGPGVVEFIYGGIPYAVIKGMKEAEKLGKSELAWGLIEGAKRGVLGLMFKFMEPLGKWLQAPILGTIFGAETAMNPEATTRDIATSAATGFVFPFMSPGHKLGLNEYRAEVRKRANAALAVKEREAIKQEIGKPLMTVDDSVDVSRTAVMFRGKVYSSLINDMHPHSEIIKEFALPEQGVIRGYIDKRGAFVPIYPEEAVNLIKKWEENGIRVGDTFVHFRETDQRVQNVLDPNKHMGLLHGSERKLAANYGLEKDGGLMIARVYGYRDPSQREEVIPAEGIYIGRDSGPVLRASSQMAKKLKDRAKQEVSRKSISQKDIVKEIITAQKIHEEWAEIPEEEQPWRGGSRTHMAIAEQKNIVLSAIKKGERVREAATLLARWKERHVFWKDRVTKNPKLAEQAGDADWHQKWIDIYDNALNLLQTRETGLPRGQYAPDDADAIQLVFERMVRDAGYVGLDTETSQGVKYFTPQKVINVSHDLTSQLHKNLIKNEEITFDLLGNRDIDGTPYYAVSIFPERESKPIPVKDFTPEHIKQYIIDNRDLLTMDGNNFGGWVENGNVILDVSRTVPSKWEAIRLGKKYGQKAIYDLAARQTIMVDEAYASMQEGIMGGRPGLPGIPEGEPETRSRKFLKTVKESITTEEQLRQKVEEIKPQDYEVLHDKDALANAEFRVSTPEGITQAIQDLRDGKVSVRDSGYLGHTLMKKLQEMGDFERAAEVVDIMDYARRDAGRLIRTASLWSNTMNVQTFLRWAQKQLDVVNSKRTWLDMHTGGKKVTLTEADKIEIMKKFADMEKIEDPTQKTAAYLEIVDYVAVKVPPGISEKIDAFRYQNMLSGIKTFERNTFENAINTFITRPWDLISQGLVDYGKSLFTGKERRAYVKNVKDYYKSLFNSMPTALTAFRKAWAGEFTLEKPELMGTKDVVGLFEARRQKLMPKSLTIAQRFLEAQDRFFSALIYAGDRSTQIKNGMSEVEADVKATEMAQRYLYRERTKLSNKDLSLLSEALNGVGYGIEQFRRVPGIGKFAGWMVPFIRTPIKKGIAMLEYSPVTFLRRPSHWMSQEAQGRMTTASIIIAMGAFAAAFGETTWTPPRDEEGKKWFYASGRKPFSIKIGEKWIPFWYLGPFALAFAFPAAIKYYAEESNTALTDDEIEKISKIAQGIAQFTGSQSSAQQIGNLFAMLEGDVDLSLGKNFTYTIGQMIPAQGLLRWIAQAVDPVYRQTPHDIDELIKNIPFWSKTLPPHEKPFGEISERDLVNLFLPYDIGVMDRDYEEDLIIGEVSRSLEYLERYRNRLNKDYEKGLISEKEYDKKWDRSIDALDQVIKRLDKLDKFNAGEKK